MDALIPMPLVNTAFAPGGALAAAQAMESPDLRALALAEYAYFSGNPEKASHMAEPYLLHQDPALSLSACWIYGYANLATGEIAKSRFALTEVQNILRTLDEHTPPQVRAFAVFTTYGACVLLHLPLPENIPPLQTLLRLLPPGLQSFGLYIQAHHTYLQGDYSKTVGLVEAALSLQPDTYPIPSIYLHLVATMAYMGLKRVEEAKSHLLAGWSLAQPDDLIEGFGEHHGLLGGMLEAVIKKDWPEDFKRIISITYRFSAGWRKIHNPDTGNSVADNLTTTEFAVCMLAARGWTNQEICDHMGISVNTVKQYISIALQKLHIRQRKDLKQFMLK